MYKIKIRRYISSGTHKIYLGFSIFYMVFIFLNQAPWTYKLPLAFLIDSLAISKCYLPTIKSWLYVVLIFNAAPDNDIAIIYKFLTINRVIIVAPCIVIVFNIYSPSHRYSFSFHHLHLDKCQINILLLR